MNTKWYISTLIILLALIGLNQEQTKLANQQIVLQFTDAEITSKTGHDDALATVTHKLEALGIVNIEIIESNDAQLSIRYYSDIDASTVGEFLAQDGLSLKTSDVDQLPIDFPKDKLPETFSIVVSDLQQSSDGFGLNGKLAFELNQDYKRFSNPAVFQFNNAIVIEKNSIDQVAFKLNTVIAITIDTASNTIPEVRAGPLSNWNSLCS